MSIIFIIMLDIDVITKTVDHALRNPAIKNYIEAIMIGGSVGREHTDSLSDIDFFVLVESCHDKVLMHQKIEVLASYFGDLGILRGPNYVPNFGYSLSAIYPTGLLCQFNVNDRKALQPNPMSKEKGLLLYDRDGDYKVFLESCRDFELDPYELFLSAFGFFWLRVLDISKEIKRGLLWLSLEYLTDMRNQIVILERIKNNCPPPGLNFNKPTKSLEKDVGSLFLLKLERTLPPLRMEEVCNATIYTIEWFLQEAEAYIRQNNIKARKELETARIVAESTVRDLARIAGADELSPSARSHESV